MGNTPLISCIIPAYNAEKFIGNCIESVLQQTYTNFEVVIVDDGSQDQTGKICDSYALADFRIRVIHKKNAGVSAARNTGITEAKGALICFLDADDWLCANIFEMCVKNYKPKNINVWGATSHLYNGIKVKEECIAGNFSREEIIANAIYKVNSDMYDFGTFFRAVWGKLFEKEILDQYKLRFPEDLYMGEDAVFLINYLVHVSGINLIASDGYNYNRTNEGSATSKYHSDLYGQNKLQYEKILSIIERERLQENEMIFASLVNFRWWMMTTLIDNGIKGIVKKEMPFWLFLDQPMQWFHSYEKDMKKAVKDDSYICKRYLPLYLHRENINFSSICKYYIFPRALSKISKFITN